MKREFSVSTIKEGSVLKVLPTGWIDTVTSAEFDNTICSSTDGIEQIVIMLGDVEYISSSGLRVLLGLHKLMAGKGGLKIVNVRKIVMDVFEVTGFSDNLDIELIE